MTWIGYTVVSVCWGVLVWISLYTWFETCVRWFERPLTERQRAVLLMWWNGAIRE